jgi:hypothetical protein
VGKEGRVLVIRSIRVVYSLRLAADRRPDGERVHGFHAGFCPVAKTLEGAVEIETELGFRDP